MIERSKVKALAFDFGGTIDSPFLHWMKVYLKVYQEQLHLPLEVENFSDAYVYTERELERLQLVKPTDGLLETQRTKTFLQFDYLFGHGVLPAEAYNRQQLAKDAARLVTDFSKRSVEANKPVLELLSRNFPLHIVSNYYGNLYTLVSEAGLSPFFKSITDSTVVGIRKPDPAIWAHAFQANGLKPEEVVVIGDSYKNDIAPALSLGCQVIKCCATESDRVEGITCISEFTQLKTFFC